MPRDNQRGKFTGESRSSGSNDAPPGRGTKRITKSVFSETRGSANSGTGNRNSSNGRKTER